MSRALIAALLLAAVAGMVIASDDPRRARYVRGVPAVKPVVDGHFEDPYGLPPAVSPDTEETDLPEPPPWAVLIWRTTDGRTCQEPGQLIDNETPGRGDQLPGIHAVEDSIPEPLVGSLRPDAKSGTGIQFYNLGRFLPYPTQEGGSCGRVDGEAGLMFGRTQLFKRRDLGPDRTIVSGVASARVKRIRVGGVAANVGRHGGFVVVVNGRQAPRELPVVVSYDDGATRTFTG